ncbi:sugar ABC transporter substrate-binding protein [Mesorhizobium sp. DCY119]|nr:sugar ABC transporter substrate-binding protein [Mesorhizobium sp. DCY119]
MWRAGRRFFCFGAAAIVMLLPMAAQSADYQLGTMDKLRIRVVEWRTAEGAVRDWSSISGDYTVGPSGNISLPFIGEMPASGKTTTDISTAIGEELQQKFGLLDKPDASVELAEFRPVFLSGDVETPGQYPFAPNLTVLKALSLAGGLHRADAGQRIERDFINARGNFDVLVSQRNGLLARRARLVAEAEDQEQIAFPKELEESADGKKLIADETNFKNARAKRLSDQLKSIDDLKGLLTSEIASLEKKIATQNRQMELYRKELDGIGNLADRGLVVNSRVLSLEQSISDLQGKVLDMETASLRAKQDISKATQNAADLQSDRDTEIAQDRQSTESDIEGLSLKIGMYKDLIAEALSRDPGAARGSSTNEAPPVSYSIVRETDGKASEIPVDENTPVQPGDVIKVGILPIPAN